MMSCKKILILPNYNQSMELPVLVQKEATSPWVISTYKAEMPSNLPKGASRGFPLLVLHHNKRPDFVMGRLVRQKTPIVFLATQAGHDTTGRVVFLTLVTQGPIGSLKADEANLHIPEDAIAALENNPDSPVPPDKIQSLKDAISILNQRGDQESQNALNTMWNNFHNKKNYNYFASVSLREASAFPPDSEKACFGGGPSRPFPINLMKNKYVAAGVVVLFLFLLLKQCHDTHHEAQQQGEAAKEHNTPL